MAIVTWNQIICAHMTFLPRLFISHFISKNIKRYDVLILFSQNIIDVQIILSGLNMLPIYHEKKTTWAINFWISNYENWINVRFMKILTLNWLAGFFSRACHVIFSYFMHTNINWISGIQCFWLESMFTCNRNHWGQFNDLPTF